MAAGRRVIELRRGGRALGGSYLYEGDALITGWHSHEVHQIEYAIGGVVEVETDSAHYLLPPQQAAWIPAGLEHQATMNPDVKTVAVMFDRALIPDGGDRARILAVSPLIREMMIYALRWPIDRAGTATTVSDGFFRTLADLVSEALDHEAPLSLPTSDHPIVAAAMAYTKEHLDIGDRRRGQPRGRGVGAHVATAVPRHARAVVAHLPAARPHAAGDGAAGRAGAVGAGDRRPRSASTASARSPAPSPSSAVRHRPRTAKGLPADRIDTAGLSRCQCRNRPSRSREFTAACQR